MLSYRSRSAHTLLGDWAEKYPESVKALHDAGHEVMSHSNHHDHYNSLTAEEWSILWLIRWARGTLED